MTKAFSEMSPAEIEAWNAENGLTEDDDDYRYPECGMTKLAREIWTADKWSFCLTAARMAAEQERR
jgi:hypothetical protein